ncbi:unnamed protein product [Dicrocoelium dendriticum]|nr:unnamed protein product [Dicrocoelium dendriticum]
MNCFVFCWLATVLFPAQGCFKSAMYYRAKTRSNSHIFLPGEYQPPQLEHTMEASGPLDARDFQHSVPSKWLVRVDSPYISFDSEEARWMTEGCRDRLIKLATQIQNVWANQEVKLRVMRAWIKPPPNYKPRPHAEVPTQHNTHSDWKNGDRDGTLLYEGSSDQIGSSQLHRKEKLVTERDKTREEETPTKHKKQQKYALTKTSIHNNNQILNLMPEMIVDEEPQTMLHRNMFDNKLLDQSAPAYSALNYGSRPFAELRWAPWRTSKSKPGSHPSHVFNTPSRRRLAKIDDFSRGSAFSSNQMSRFPRDFPPSNLTVAISPADSRGRTRRLFSRSIVGAQFQSTGRSNQQVNTMTQARYEQWLNMRMEEFHYAGRAVDIQLAFQPYSNQRDIDVKIGLLAQMAFYVAQFDWCYFSRSRHVHCSVKPDSSITSQWFGCFPGSAKLTKENGTVIMMRDLSIGDRILTLDTTTNLLLPTSVVAFIHRDEHMWRPMVKVTFESVCNEPWSPLGRLSFLKLTPNHLIYVSRLAGKRLQIAAVFASMLKSGDSILVTPKLNGSSCKGVIINITVQNEWIKEDLGMYAPLTQTGTLVVDDVFVSSFAQFSNERIAYLSTLPLNFYFVISCWWKSIQTKVYHNGIHWYARWIYRLTSPVLPKWLFFSET